MNTFRYTQSIIILLVFAGLTIGCFDDRDEDFAFEPFTTISFGDSPGSWTSIDDLSIDIVADGLASARVVAIAGRTIDLGTVSFNSGMATLNTSWATIEDAGRIEVIGADPSEGDFRARFSLSKVSPLSVSVASSVHHDSTVMVNIGASTVRTDITSIRLLRKEGSNGTFDEIFTQGVNALTFDEEVSFTAPSENDLPLGESIMLQLEITSAAGLSEVEEFSISLVPVELTSTGQVTLVSGGANVFDLAGLTVDSLAAAQDEDRDVMLVPDGNALNLEAGMATGTSFVVAGDFDFSSATFQLIRDAFAEGTPVTEISDIANLPVNTVILAKVGELSGAAEFVVLQLGEVVKTASDAGSITIQYKARR